MFFVSYIMLWTLTIVNLVGVFMLFRHLGKQLEHSTVAASEQGPEIGSHDGLNLQTIDGRNIQLGDGRSYLIAFTSPRCAACMKVLPIIREELSRGRETRRAVVLVHQGDVDAAEGYVDEMPASVLTVADPERQLAGRWNVRGTPYFVVTDGAGVVRRKGRGSSQEQVASFMNEPLGGSYISVDTASGFESASRT